MNSNTPPEAPSSKEQPDYPKIHNIVSALEFLRKESEATGSEEIHTLISATFDQCLTIYSFLLRHGQIPTPESCQPGP